MCAEEAKLIDKSSANLPPAAARLVREIVRLAGDTGFNAYFVGGPIRDLLLERPTANADVTIEGDAIAIARQLKSRPNFRVVLHPSFGTAVITSGDTVLDLVTARSETYDQPGALPAVTPGTIDDDIRRRDLTINAIALALNGPREGEIIDPLNGRADLEAGLIRALHRGSFQDDATRILRAARYEARFGFRIEPETESWIRRDARCLDTISGARIHHEFVRTFEEHQPERALIRLAELGALEAIHPALTFDEDRARAFADLRSLGRRGARPANWPLLAWDVTPGAVPALARRLALRKRQAEAVAAAPRVRALERSLESELANSRLVELLDPFPLPALWALAAATHSEAVRRRTVRYLRSLRRVRPALNGDDIIALGASEGPHVGHVLRRLKTAKLDGEVRTPADEERLARELLDSSRG